ATAIADGRARSVVGRMLTAGARPEDMRLVASGGATASLPATIEHVEALRHETLVPVRVDGDGDPPPPVLRVAGMPALAGGASVGVAIDGAGVHLFGDDGRTLALS